MCFGCCGPDDEEWDALDPLHQHIYRRYRMSLAARRDEATQAMERSVEELRRLEGRDGERVRALCRAQLRYAKANRGALPPMSDADRTMLEAYRMCVAAEMNSHARALV